MQQYKFILGILLASLFSGVFTLGGYLMLQKDDEVQNISEKQEIVLSNYTEKKNEPDYDYKVPEGLNFINASEKVIPAVVHIKTRYSSSNRYSSALEDIMDLWGNGEDNSRGQGTRMSSGSGVIISSDGYIATNNHVIEDASSIEVVLNDKRSYRAVLIGTDPTTDLALIRIKAEDLPFVPYGNSDRVRPGQWVLAIGNPFDLTSTVTAGIVSAKARNIGIIRSNGQQNLSIESFIQTDAAVNPGNSGGALVDLNGKLIGINTAIATKTGYSAGYSFAVPVALVKKIMDDLLEFGVTQRALMGVNIDDIDASNADIFGLDKVEGVLITGVNKDGGADEAGIMPGDVVLKINEIPVNNTSELQELVARNRPGDIINVAYKRDNDIYVVKVTLKNIDNNTDVIRAVKTIITKINELGAEVTEISDKDKELLNIEQGIKIVKITEGKLRDARLEDGFIITHIDKIPVSSVDELMAAISNSNQEFLLEGYYLDGQKVYYQLNMKEEVVEDEEKEEMQ
ncbi:S1C family serine protease [Chondrinema litorale]|uniref:S1C family serine protease n=1 Tax=Chondrinema litorale TaxID=2994555 RepID=UPI002543E78E|nr:trypsin-like peptidase domain-containing protein [Chondrinema litorale]UZR95541.1 trypsin-like peptidase domain-containing protein [Chondrinema litorale]